MARKLINQEHQEILEFTEIEAVRMGIDVPSPLRLGSVVDGRCAAIVFNRYRLKSVTIKPWMTMRQVITVALRGVARPEPALS